MGRHVSAPPIKALANTVLFSSAEIPSDFSDMGRTWTSAAQNAVTGIPGKSRLVTKAMALINILNSTTALQDPCDICDNPDVLAGATWSQTDVLIADLTAEIARFARTALSSPSETLAIVSVIFAAGLVLVSSFVKTMIPLRWLAIGSNFGFIVYGALHPSMPMLLLHSLLVPINVYRLAEMVRLTRHVRAVEANDEQLGIWLRPYMRSATLADGAFLFRKGDIGDRIYLLVKGVVEMEEIDVSVKPGEIFGEIAVFAPDRQRRATARCVGQCKVLSIDDNTFKQLCYQNPAFGFKLIGLIAARLSADLRKSRESIENSVAGVPAGSNLGGAVGQ